MWQRQYGRDVPQSKCTSTKNKQVKPLLGCNTTHPLFYTGSSFKNVSLEDRKSQVLLFCDDILKIAFIDFFLTTE
jgi:hypothetical protein